MATSVLSVGEQILFEREHFPLLLESLESHGYQIIGPTIRENAIVYDTLASIEDLPIGYTDEQEGGYYRLKKRPDLALFGYNVGPHSWKQFLHPPMLRLWSAKRSKDGFQILPENQEPPKLAFLGIRSCDLHAIRVQDAVFLQTSYSDLSYRMRRDRVCLIVVRPGKRVSAHPCTPAPRPSRDRVLIWL